MTPPRKRPSAEITGYIDQRDLATPLPEDPRLPAAYDDRDIAAMKACREGVASPEQQRRAMEWVVWASGTYHRVWRRDPHEAAYLAGRREMGTEVVKLMNLRTRNQSEAEQG